MNIKKNKRTITKAITCAVTTLFLLNSATAVFPAAKKVNKKNIKVVIAYDKNGFNKEGINKYTKTKYDKNGYDRFGFNKNGFNKVGINKYTKATYDKNGFNKDGYNKYGYNKDGYDKTGYDKDGCDEYGYNKEGYDSEGYNSDGYNKGGYNKEGYDKEGYDKDGYNKDLFNREGYDVEGYDKYGYNKSGYDNKGYDEDGYDKQGFNVSGYNKEGYDKTGYDKYEFNKDGYSVEGYNKDGYDKDGYDRQGYNKDGYDKAGNQKLVYDKSGNIIGYTNIISNNDNDYYFNGLIRNSELNMKGRVDTVETKFVYIIVKDYSGKRLCEDICEVKPNGTYETNLFLSIGDGHYLLDICYGKERYSTYYYRYFGIPIECQNNTDFFKASQISGYNAHMFNEFKNQDISNYLIKTANDEIKQKVNALIAGVTDSKQKVMIIHDWIADNIYYNEDAYNASIQNRKPITWDLANSKDVYETKLAVCAGYADLFQAMVREAGIPCRTINGYTIQLGSKTSWENVDSSEIQHAWNEVYINGRWIIIDVTWDTRNRYENNKFVNDEKTHVYFDPTLDNFSLDHKILEIKTN